MIVRVSGKLIEVNEDFVVIERDGLAWEVLVPRYGIGELSACRGREVVLHTIEFFEGGMAGGQLTPRLLGFLHAEDKTFFSRFITVDGIGPRKALRAFAEPARKIAAWVRARDTDALTRLPGIGKRTAELIVASLKDKLDDLMTSDGEILRVDDIPSSGPQRDALEILVVWGDSRVDAQRWLQRAGQLYADLQSADEWVRAAYRIKTGVEV